VIVEGLDAEVSWQDLKDFGRTVASSVSFADVYREKGEGVIEYRDYEDFKYALKKLDGARIDSRNGKGKEVKVYADKERNSEFERKDDRRGGGGRGRRHRSKSPRSRSRSPRRSRSRSRSADRRGRRDSRSPSRSRSRSRSGSASRKVERRSESPSGSQKGMSPPRAVEESKTEDSTQNEAPQPVMSLLEDGAQNGGQQPIPVYPAQ